MGPHKLTLRGSNPSPSFCTLAHVLIIRCPKPSSICLKGTVFQHLVVVPCWVWSLGFWVQGLGVSGLEIRGLGLRD